jgi:hypothetical protein
MPLDESARADAFSSGQNASRIRPVVGHASPWLSPLNFDLNGIKNVVKTTSTVPFMSTSGIVVLSSHAR